MPTDDGPDRVPERVLNAASAHDLGALRQQDRHTGPADVIPDITAVLLFSGFMIVVGVVLATCSNAPVPRLFVFICVAIAVAVCVGAAVQAARIERTRLYEFDAGLVHEAPNGAIAFPWREVEYVETLRTVRGSGQDAASVVREYWVRRRDGSAELKMKASGVDRIADRIAVVAVEEAQQRLARGEPVVFGVVTMEPDRLVADGRSIAWADVDRMTRKKDDLHVYRTGHRKPWTSVRVSAVPDSRAVLTLVAAAVKAA
jgi:hypothetical protein